MENYLHVEWFLSTQSPDWWMFLHYTVNNIIIVAYSSSIANHELLFDVSSPEHMTDVFILVQLSTIAQLRLNHAWIGDIDVS